MHQLNELSISVLVEAKTIYTKQLVGILRERIYEGLWSIYSDADEINKKDTSSDTQTVVLFQKLLKDTPKWNQTIIDNEYERCVNASGCEWLAELISAVFISNAKILTAVRRIKSKKNIDLHIPKTSTFIHKCYIEAAREFYKDPLLFDITNTKKYEQAKNKRETYNIIDVCIENAIRKQLPFKQIISKYLGNNNSDKSSDDDDFSGNKSNNMMKLVKKYATGDSDDETPLSVASSGDKGVDMKMINTFPMPVVNIDNNIELSTETDKVSPETDKVSSETDNVSPETDKVSPHNDIQYKKKLNVDNISANDMHNLIDKDVNIDLNETDNADDTDDTDDTNDTDDQDNKNEKDKKGKPRKSDKNKKTKNKKFLKNEKNEKNVIHKNDVIVTDMPNEINSKINVNQQIKNKKDINARNITEQHSDTTDDDTDDMSEDINNIEYTNITENELNLNMDDSTDLSENDIEFDKKDDDDDISEDGEMSSTNKDLNNDDDSSDDLSDEMPEISKNRNNKSESIRTNNLSTKTVKNIGKSLVHTIDKIPNKELQHKAKTDNKITNSPKIKQIILPSSKETKHKSKKQNMLNAPKSFIPNN